MRGIRLLVALLRADAYGSGAFGPEVARAARRLAAGGRGALWAVGAGGVGMALGFFGSHWLAPAERFVGTVMVGTLGVLGGLAWGLRRERRRPRHPPG